MRGIHSPTRRVFSESFSLCGIGKKSTETPQVEDCLRCVAHGITPLWRRY